MLQRRGLDGARRTAVQIDFVETRIRRLRAQDQGTVRVRIAEHREVRRRVGPCRAAVGRVLHVLRTARVGEGPAEPERAGAHRERYLRAGGLRDEVVRVRAIHGVVRLLRRRRAARHGPRGGIRRARREKRGRRDDLRALIERIRGADGRHEGPRSRPFPAGGLKKRLEVALENAVPVEIALVVHVRKRLAEVQPARAGEASRRKKIALVGMKRSELLEPRLLPLPSVGKRDAVGGEKRRRRVPAGELSAHAEEHNVGVWIDRPQLAEHRLHVRHRVGMGVPNLQHEEIRCIARHLVREVAAHGHSRGSAPDAVERIHLRVGKRIFSLRVALDPVRDGTPVGHRISARRDTVGNVERRARRVFRALHGRGCGLLSVADGIAHHRHENALAGRQFRDEVLHRHVALRRGRQGKRGRKRIDCGNREECR